MRNRSITFLITLVLLSSFTFGNVYISEIMYNPNQGGDAQYEWIELYNENNSAINLSGWKIDDNTFDDITIGPLSYGVIARTLIGSESFEQFYGNNDSAWNSTDGTYNTSDGNFVLSNTGDSINLSNGNTDEDILSYSSVFANDNNKSLERYNFNSTRLGESVSVNGTPGMQNSIFDITPPVFVNISSPTKANTGDTVIINFSADAAHANISVDNQSYAMTKIGSFFTHSISIHTTNLSSIQYNSSFYDLAGNVNSTRLYSIIITDTIAPTFVANNLPTTGTTGENFLVNITANDNIGVADVNITINGLLFRMTANATDFIHTIPVPLNNVSSIPYTILIYDSAGNVNASISKTLTVTDNDAPSISQVQINTSSLKSASTFTLTGNIADNIGISSVSLNNTQASFTQNNFTLKATPLSLGCTPNANCSRTIIVNDSSNNSARLLQLLFFVDDNAPAFTNVSLRTNVYNYRNPKEHFLADIYALDNVQVVNGSCQIGSVITYFRQVTAQPYQCNISAPISLATHDVVISVNDFAGNKNSTTLNFTTQKISAVSLSLENKIISDLNQQSRFLQLNATLVNNGPAQMHSPVIIYTDMSKPNGQDLATIIPITNNCVDLKTGQSCVGTFNISVRPNIAAGDYFVLFDVNWTDNDLDQRNLDTIVESKISILANKNISVPANLSTQTLRGTNKSIILTLTANGNVDLTNTVVSYTAGTLAGSKVHVSPLRINRIPFGTSQNVTVTLVMPPEEVASNLTGTLLISSDGISRSVPLLVEVLGEHTGWNIQGDPVLAVSRSNETGKVTILTINNSDNQDNAYAIGYNGSLKKFLFATSNPTSASVSALQLKNLTINHKANALQSQYDLTINVSSTLFTDFKSINVKLLIDDTDPIVSLPIVNDSFVKGQYLISPTFTDANKDYIEFYVDGVLLNSTQSPYTFRWNTNQSSEGRHTLTVVGYDKAGNHNQTSVRVIVDNINEVPIITNLLNTFSFMEDTVNDSINLSTIFTTLDDDTLSFSFDSNSLNLSIAIASGVVTLTPAQNFFGTEIVNFTATDSSGKKALLKVTILILNVNDNPSTPSPTFPLLGSTVHRAFGSLTLKWNPSVDIDNDILFYNVFFGNDSSLLELHTTTSNPNLTVTKLINSTRYYWKIQAFDGNNFSSNSSVQDFTLLFDFTPNITFAFPSAEFTMTENSSQKMNVTASDPQNDSLTYEWYVDGVLKGTSLSFTYTPGFTDAGTRLIEAVVLDQNDNVVKQKFTVTVLNNNRAPVLELGTNYTVIEDTLISIPFLAYDPDNQTLTFTSDPPYFTFFNTSNNNTFATWTPVNDNVATHTITFTASDGSNATKKSFTITVIDVNDPPVIGLGNFSILEDETTVVNASAIDPENNTLSYTVVSSINASVTQTGQITLLATNDQVGAQWLFLSVSDGVNATSKNITVTVIDTNDAPVLSVEPEYTILEDTVLNLTVNVSDIDKGETFNFSSNNANFTLLTSKNNTAIFRFAPDNAHVGLNQVTISVSDRRGLTVSARINVTVINVNDLPVIHTAAITAHENVPLNLTIAATDIDKGDSLTYSINMTFGAKIFDGTTNNFTGVGSFNSSSGHLIFTPTQLDVGVFNVRINVSDGHVFVTKDIIFSINNANNPPRLPAIEPLTATEDTLHKFIIKAEDDDLKFGDRLTYSINDTRFSVITDAQFNATFSWVPTNSDVGPNTFIINVTDSEGAQSSQKITIYVINVNDAPVFAGIEPVNKIIGEDKSQLFRANFTDIDVNDTLKYEWYVNNVNQNVSTASFTFPATGTSAVFTVRVKAIDNSSASAEGSTQIRTSALPFSSRYSGTYQQVSLTNVHNATFVTIELANSGLINFGNQVIDMRDVVDIDNNVHIANGIISVNSNELPELNKRANLTLFTTISRPVILFNDNYVTDKNLITNICTSCTIVSNDGSKVVFTVPGFSSYTAVDQSSLYKLSLPNPISFPSEAGQTTVTTFSLSNQGTQTLTFVSATLTPVNNFSIDISLDNNNFGKNIVISSLASQESKTIYVRGTVPSILPPRTIGSLFVSSSQGANASSNINLVTPSKLKITDVQVDVGSRDKTALEGSIIDVEPGEDINIDITFANLLTGSVDIEDIDVDVIIRDIDDGDDIDDDDRISSIEAGRDEDIDFDFLIPFGADEGIYSVKITGRGQDTNRQVHIENFNFSLRVKKNRHDLRVIRSELIPDSLGCNRDVLLEAEFKNLGKDDEDDVRVEVIQSALNIYYEKSKISLSNDGFDSDSSFDLIFSKKVDRDVPAGIYPITLRVYRDDHILEDTESINLQITDCQLRDDFTQFGSFGRGDQTLPVISIEKPVLRTVTKKKVDREIDEFMLIILLLVMLGAIILLIGSIIILIKKERSY